MTEITNYASVVERTSEKAPYNNKNTSTHNTRCQRAWPRDFVVGLRRITADPCAKCPKNERLGEIIIAIIDNECF